MRELLIQFAIVAWFVHGTFGATFHHAHPGAALCAQQGEPCAHVCPEHAHGRHHSNQHAHASGSHQHGGHDHGQHSDSHDPQGDHGDHDHSCPSHHHDDDGSCGVVHVDATPSFKLLLTDAPPIEDLFAVKWSEATAAREHVLTSWRGPPLRPHLLFGRLLI